jgi:hypothetical protein
MTPARALSLALLLSACAGGEPVAEDLDLADVDGDGWTVVDGDCDDNDPSRAPLVDETCNGIDDDCDFRIDDDAVDARTWHPDEDGDGYGNPTSLAYACEAPAGFIADDTDCDDDRGNVNPEAFEACNGFDDDCDGLVDDDDDPTTLVDTLPWHLDADGDGRGAPEPDVEACLAPTADHLSADFADDCDDTDATVFPGAPEVAGSGIDADCDGAVTCFVDLDGDDHGTADTTLALLPAGCTGLNVAPVPDDCDDGNAAIHPSAAEICNDGIDDDCNGLADDDDVHTGDLTWFTDADGDGYGALPEVFACVLPAGAADNDADCDDGDLTIRPGADETCDEVDEDCNGVVDDGAVDAFASWADDDGDGFGDGVPVRECEPPADHVGNSADCDDTSADAYPDAPTVVCDGVDNDCDPATVEPLVVRRNGVDALDLADALASATPGDLVEVCEGTHPAAGLVLVDGLTITGLGQPGNTVLDAGELDAVLEVPDDADVQLTAITLTGGVGRPTDGRGGAMWVGASATLRLTDVHVRDNVGAYGGGLYVSSGSTVTFDGVELTGNAADDPNAILPAGGAIYAEPGVVLEGTALVRDNRADICGGVYLGDGGVLDGSPGVFRLEDNRAIASFGGGMCAYAGTTVSHVEVHGNTTTNSGAGIWALGVTLSDAVLEQNEAQLDGGGLYTWNDNQLTDVILRDNDAGFDGGGLALVNGGTATVTGGEIRGNDAEFFSVYGGGIATDGAITLVGVDLGPPGDNTPNDIGLQDTEVGFDFSGVTSVTCDDSLGTCQ